ncbi:MAG: hypothetical protein IKR21_02525, partial [Oscillospiraceae bacterium]|nr:hypothetical protein [Oscillospiraceae bacterium]
MTGFAALPVAIQNFVCFWSLFLCFICITDCILLWRQRRYGLFAVALLDFLCGYFCIHLCRELTELRLHRAVFQPAVELMEMPWAVFIICILIFTAGSMALYANTRVWRRRHISAASIKESIDGLPAGICCFTENGRCLLSNHRMNAVCRDILGRDLQNGLTLAEKAREKPVFLLPDGTAVSFRERKITYRKEPIYELIADDVTELYRKGERLRRENERARALGVSMKAYGETIADTVRRREILDAKIFIHDEMNRMLLATQKAAKSEDRKERDEILRMWRGRTGLFRHDRSGDAGSSVVSDLNALAAVIGIKIDWDGCPDTEDREALRLFLMAAREAMANAAKHAGAESITIAVKNDSNTLTAVFTNDGENPADSVP